MRLPHEPAWLVRSFQAKGVVAGGTILGRTEGGTEGEGEIDDQRQTNRSKEENS